MKRTFAITVVTAILTTAAGLVIRMDQPDAPKPITVIPLTEKFIKDQVTHERKEKQARERLERATRAAQAVYRTNGCSDEYAELTAKMAIDTGLNPRILAAVVVSESSAKSNAIYHNDIGLMQINTKVWKYSRAELKDPQRNMQIGARILSKHIHQFGLVEGLHHYNGLGCPDNTYAESVLARAGIKG